MATARSNSPVRTRIAPSPTGALHVGTARAALYNELFARQNNGAFIMRIEDTDTKRSQPEFEQSIMEGLKWLGLEWDEGPDIGGPHGPYRQSERTELHQQAIQQLLNNGHAYQDSDAAAIKLKVEPQTIIFEDIIRGTVTLHTDSWGGDFIIARSITDPLYHLAVVTDDAAQNISHVIRGEDHLTNTARHILLQRALKLPTPEYAHLPLLLDNQRRKLSKRAGEVSLLAYRDQGYLPEAMLNYLSLLGWNPGTDQEFFTHEELIDKFKLEQVHSGGAIFDIKKLQAVNKHYLRRLSSDEFFNKAKPYLKAQGFDVQNEDYWRLAAATEQERVATLAELPEALMFFKHPSTPPDYKSDMLIWRKSDNEETKRLLQQLVEYVTKLPANSFTAQELENTLMKWIDENNLGRGDTLWPMRVALTGQKKSPGPFEVAATLKQENTIKRLEHALIKISNP